MKEQIIDDYTYIVTTLDEVKSYVICPMLYHLRYVVKWQEKRRQFLTIDELYLLLMRDTIRYFFSRHTSLRTSNEYEMLSYFKRQWSIALRKWKVWNLADGPPLIQRAVNAIELFAKQFRIATRGYGRHRAVAANAAYDVPIGGGIKLAGTLDALLLRHYMQPEQTLQVIHIINKKACDTAIDAKITPFYKNVIDWMFGDELDSVLLYDITNPSGITNRQQVTVQGNADAIIAIRNVASSMYIDSIHSLAPKAQCNVCAYQQVCKDQTLRDLLRLK